MSNKSVFSTLQYRLSNGSWVDVDDYRIDEFLTNCVKFNADVTDTDDAVKQLQKGIELRNDPNDWYSYCRMIDKNAEIDKRNEADRQHKARESKRIHCKRCGQSGFDGESPFTTLRGSGICDDCL